MGLALGSGTSGGDGFLNGTPDPGMLESLLVWFGLGMRSSLKVKDLVLLGGDTGVLIWTT